MAHASARLTPLGRRLLVERVRSGWTITKAAQAAGISRQTGSKWIARFRREGESGLVDRSSGARRLAIGERVYESHGRLEFVEVRRLQRGPWFGRPDHFDGMRRSLT
jgi:hypothetical protein